MIDVSSAGWLGFLVLLAVSHFAGLRASRCMHWSDAAASAGLPAAVGHALAPFLTGLLAVVALWLLPGSTHAVHLLFVILTLGLIPIVSYRFRRPKLAVAEKAPQVGESILAVFVALWIAMLLVNTLFLPLNQNDALEYAMVGRILYATRDLASYPAISPQANASGFFAPWTHPPLYVALIYLMDVVQENARSPGLMRLVSPWFAIAATNLCYRLACLQSRRAGLLAALIFISTPLFFGGADSALIDALPVLGIALVLAGVVGLDSGNRNRGLVIGLLLGMALWTHSQAILFLPLTIVALMAQHGLANWRTCRREVSHLALAALLIAAWPYFRNVLIFGSPISDNPAVFALPELSWPEYFRIARGLDGWLPILQYGLFKGWFALTAFGWTFWLMTWGGITLLRNASHMGLLAIMIRGTKMLGAGPSVMLISMTFTLTYLAGIVASITLGLDLMIKNERYTLVILPFVSLIAAHGIDAFASRIEIGLNGAQVPSWKWDATLVSAALFVAVLLFQLGYVGWYYKWRLVPSSPASAELDAEKSFDRVLDSALNLRAIRWMDRALPTGAIVLSFRPADMYYARQRMVSYLDPSLLAVYREPNIDKAGEMLRNLGITHVHMPDYGSPVTYGTALSRLLASPAHASLLYVAGGTQIFKLGASGKTAVFLTDITPGEYPWSRWTQTSLPGLNSLVLAFGPAGHDVRDNEPSDLLSPFPFAQRDFSTFSVTGIGTRMQGGRGAQLPVVAGSEYRVTLSLAGSSFVRVWLGQFDIVGRLISESVEPSATRIDELVVSSEGGIRQSSRRFKALPGAASIRIAVEQDGYSSLKIDKATLEEIRNE